MYCTCCVRGKQPDFILQSQKQYNQLKCIRKSANQYEVICHSNHCKLYMYCKLLVTQVIDIEKSQQ